MKHWLLLSAWLSLPLFLFGQETGIIQGKVIDADSKRPLEAANIVLQEMNLGTSSGKDGSFHLRQIPAGSHVLRISYVGYSPKLMAVQVERGEVVDLQVALEATVLPGQTIIVTATRARERESPVAFGTLTARELSERYSTQDIPELLSELPSTTFYSENGNGIGYNYLTIRGFDQRRISVMVNGIPQNDPEDHDVYGWISRTLRRTFRIFKFSVERAAHSTVLRRSVVPLISLPQASRKPPVLISTLAMEATTHASTPWRSIQGSSANDTSSTVVFPASRVTDIV